jgi:hypothetical protein
MNHFVRHNESFILLIAEYRLVLTPMCDVTIMHIFDSWRRWLPCVMYELCVYFTAEEDGDSHVWHCNSVYFLQLKMATPMCYVLIVCIFYSRRWWQLCDILIAWFITAADGDFWVWHYNYVYFLQLKMATPMCYVLIVCTFYSCRWWQLCVIF